MLRKTLRSIALTVALGLAHMSALAQIDAPDTYVYIEVSVREATLEGMRQRLALLRSSEYSIDTDQAVDESARLLVADAYALFGSNAGAHAAYGTRHAAAIKEWLDTNPEWKDRIAALEAEFRSLSEQLSAARRPS